MLKNLQNQLPPSNIKPATIKPKFTYSQVGIDTIIETEAARILYDFSKKTWINRAGKLGEPQALVDSFSGACFARIAHLPAGTLERGNANGLGTRPKLRVLLVAITP